MRLAEDGNWASSIVSLESAKRLFYRSTQYTKSGQEVFNLLPAFCGNPYGSYPVSVGCWYCFMSSYHPLALFFAANNFSAAYADTDNFSRTWVQAQKLVLYEKNRHLAIMKNKSGFIWRPLFYVWSIFLAVFIYRNTLLCLRYFNLCEQFFWV